MSIIFPYGGEIGWNYGSFEYLGNRTLREVTGRVVEPDSAHTLNPPWTYGISRPDAPNSVTVHSGMTLTDASGVGAKTWSFITGNTPAWQVGLASEYRQLSAANGTILQDDTYAWSQDPAGRPYISAKTSVIGQGTGNQQSALTTQALDQYGNLTSSAVYPYNNTASALQTYNNTYLTTSTYTSYYIYNLLNTSTVTTGGSTIRLVNDYYQGVQNQGGLPASEYDANSPVPWNSKAVMYASTTNVRGTSYYYYPYGAVSSLSSSDGAAITASSDSATNYAAPQSISVQSYNQSVSYNSWLGVTSQTGQNGEQSTMTYDTYGRPSTATSPYGAVTNYSYSTSAPFQQMKTGPDGFTRTTVDGFGRTTRVERGPSSTNIQSVVDTVYAPCACSPLGKIQRVSQPYQSGGSASNWTTYTYDGLGRTLSTQQPDGASTTTYAYSGNQTTTTDPAGKSKQFTNDALGNLITVVEPDPCVATNTLTANYTYNWMNQITQVSMQRPGVSYASNGVCSEIGSPTTQTRTFAYNNAGLLTSATNPENGTVTYLYGSDNTLYSKTDAKGQVTRYTYDLVKRLIETQQYPTGVNNPEDLCGRVFYTWGTDPTSYNYGRLVTVQSSPPAYGTLNGACGRAYLNDENFYYYGPFNNSYYEYYNATSYSYLGPITDQFYESYNYYQAGDAAGKTFILARHSPDTTWSSAGVGVNYQRDTAGRITATSYSTILNGQAGNSALTTAYDSMGRPSSLTDSNNTQWVSSVQYDFAGRMQNLTYLTGNGAGATTSVSETRAYNAATGQLASLSWSGAGISGGITYSYSTTQNNGQITQAADAVSGETIVYQYDALRRLTSAASTPINGTSPTPWTQTFQFDGFGNLMAKVLNGTTNAIPVNAATNQLTSANYDLNGNMTSGAGATITYDETNRMITAQEVSGGIEYYGYGNGNKRVYRVTASGTEQGSVYNGDELQNISAPGQEQITLFGAYGEKLGVYGVQSNNCPYSSDDTSYAWACVSGLTPLSTSIWFAGRLVMDSGNAVMQDRAGTNRASGARFYPYGDEITSTSNDREKFETYQRDSYTGLDYADQRFYASSYGRFNTPDPYQASGGPSSPASWNRYAYTRGDPINRYDPQGLEDCSDSIHAFDDDGGPGPGGCGGGGDDGGGDCFLEGDNCGQPGGGGGDGGGGGGGGTTTAPQACPVIPVATNSTMFTLTSLALSLYGLSGDISNLHVSPGGTGVAYNITSFSGFQDVFTIGPYASCFYQDKVGYLLHRSDVGGRGPYFSWRGYTGPGYSLGSLQVVSSSGTNLGYADIDQYNTQDVVNLIMHNIGVMGGLFNTVIGVHNAPITDPRPHPIPGMPAPVLSTPQ